MNPRRINVLQRWSLALADPRLVWIDLAAPVCNYAALLVADAECWSRTTLPKTASSGWLAPCSAASSAPTAHVATSSVSWRKSVSAR